MSEQPALTPDEIAVITHYRTLDEDTRSMIRLLITLPKEDKPPLGTRIPIAGRAWALYGQLCIKGLIEPTNLDLIDKNQVIKAAGNLHDTIVFLAECLERSEH